MPATKAYIVFSGDTPVACVREVGWPPWNPNPELGFATRTQRNIRVAQRMTRTCNLSVAANECADDPGLPSLADWVDSVRSGR